MRFLKNNTRKALIAFAGWTIILIGLVLVPFPGPGWVIVFIGFTILAREFDWAQDMKDRVEDAYDAWRGWYVRQNTPIKIIFAVLTVLTGAIIVWMVNGYGFLDDVLGLDMMWLHSPFFRGG